MSEEKRGSTRDYRKRLTDLLITSLEEDNGLPWQKGWHQIKPFNPTTGIKYKGGNVVNLMLAQLRKGSDDPRWMTLKQANLAGYSIRKGALATNIEYWDFGQERAPRKAEVDKDGIELEKSGQEALPITPRKDAAEKREKPGVFFPAMFNGADIVGLPELRREISWEPNELAEKLISASGANIEHKSISIVGSSVVDNAAYYYPNKDIIVLPPRDRFKSDGDYYATVLHELSHWTGHPSRLNRLNPKIEQPYGSAEYAKEELRADIAAMFLCSLLGVEGEVQNHAKYTAGWLACLKEDKHEIFRASRDAELIVEYVLDLAPELREVIDSRLSDNLIPKVAPARALSGIGVDLPNFIPTDASPAPIGVGRADPRWTSCERTIREEAKKYDIEKTTINNALSMIELQFTDVMNAAETNGYSSDDMSVMLARKIVDEMRTADVRQQQWIHFCELVRLNGKSHPVEHIESALQEMGCNYREIISQSNDGNWSKQETDKKIEEMIYGSGAKRAISAEYVDEIIVSSEAVKRIKSSLDAEGDDDFMLEPIGMSGEIPEDPGVVSDEYIVSSSNHYDSVLDDAEMQGP